MITPRKYQMDGVDFLIERLYVNDHKGAGIFADPGLGKTYITLLTLQRLSDLGEANRVLIIAPLQTCINTWPTEISDLGFDFSHELIHGRKKLQLLNGRQQIDIINPDGLKWLSETGKCPWDIVVCDESTLFKNWSAKRTKILKTLLKRIPKRIILTGTPTPNTYADLFSQIYILDDGETLGKTVGFFREHYCRQAGYLGRGWEFREERESELMEKISDMVIRFDENDHLDLPPMVFNPLWVTLPTNIMREYKKLEKLLWVALDGDKTLNASNAGAKYQMCKQLANGGLYEHEGKTRTSHHVHMTKVDRMQQLHEELNHKPMIAAYLVDHDYERINQITKRTVPVIRGGMKPKDSRTLVKRWNDQDLELLAVQPQSLSHGVNLQHGGNNLCWLGLTDQNEIFQQFNKRLHRSGQTKPVHIHMVLAKDTVDEMILDRLQNKGKKQKTLLDSLKEYRKRK